MSTSAITPTASAPAGGAAPSAPAAPAGGAAVSTPSTPAAGGGAAEGGGTSSPDTGGSGDISVEQRLSQGWQKQFGEEAAEGEGEEEPPEIGEGEAEEGETDQALEGVEGEEAGEGEDTPEGEAEAEAAPEFTLDDGEPVGPVQFADFLKANPEAQKALDANPELKNKVFGALRRDEENRALREIVPDVETARAVTGAAATYQNFDNRFLGATTPEGAQKFLEYWVKEAMYTDDQGQPILKDGKYQFHPALTYTFDHIYNNKISALKQQAEKSGNERLQAALDVLMEETSPTSTAQGEIPEELRAHADALTERERALTAKEQASAREEAERQQVANQQSIDRAETKAAESVQGLLKPLFAKASLSEFEQNAALQKIGELVDESLGANSLYQAMYDSILQREPGEAREKALTAHMLKFTNEILGKIATKVVREAKGGALTRQPAKQSQVDAQRRTSKTDPKGASVGTTRTAATTDPAQLRATIVNEYKAAHGGEEPPREYLMEQMAKRSGVFGKPKR